MMEIAVGEYGADVSKVIKAALKKYYEMSSECIKLDPVFDDGKYCRSRCNQAIPVWVHGFPINTSVVHLI